MQIEGGTAAVGVFRFEDNMIQCQSECSFPTAELTFWWPEISWKQSSLAVTWVGPSGRKKSSLHIFAQRIFSQKRFNCFRGHSLRDRLPGCL